MENKKYSWTYNYSLFKHYDWIRALCYIVAITVLIICFGLFIARPYDFPGVLTENLWLIGMILAIYGISVLIALIWYRKGYVYQYTIENGNLKICRGFVPMSHEMIVNERIGSDINLKDVRSIKLNKNADSISMKGFLILTTIYADKNEIDYIYQLMKQDCVNLKSDD
ncbi:MAG: hypothetical protein SOX32_11000 [Candidatus Choladocola sp.]|nr:hypothetical protein [Candidatus Choladocola sp.]